MRQSNYSIGSAIAIAASLFLLCCNFVQAQTRKSVNLNENWVVGEAKPVFNAESFIPADFRVSEEIGHKALKQKG